MLKSLKYYTCLLGLVLALEANDVNENSWALVIGINDYQNVRKLHYAVEDAMAIKNMLINIFGFPSVVA